MKKIQTILCGSLAVLALAACSSEDNEILGGGEPQQGARTYTVTTEASMSGGAETRALDESGTTITATFATTEKVYVYKGTTQLGGYLTPQADGASTTLKGELTADPALANNDELTLVYPQSTINYTGQNGLLTGTNSIAEKYDFAKATVTVSDATTPNVTTTAATFTSQQAITKFTFTDGTNPVNVKSLTISGTGLVQSVAADGTVTTGDIDVTLATPSTTVYVAMSNTSGAKQTYTFTAIGSDDKTYIGTKSANLANGKNYTASVTLSEPEAVDLGLGVKWANMNVGATSVSDYGLFFAWGEVKGYGSNTSDGRSFNWASYKWGNGSNTLTKYNSKSNYGTVDNKTTLEPCDDAAAVNWGGSWRMPTAAECEELYATKSNTSAYTWTWYATGNTTYTVAGYEIKQNSTGNKIFLPAAGCRSGTSLGGQGSNGYYWSSSVYEDHPNYARYLYFYSDYAHMDYDDRFYGYTVRPVQNK